MTDSGAAKYAGTPEMVAESLLGIGERRDRLLHSHDTAQRLRPRAAEPVRARGRAHVRL